MPLNYGNQAASIANILADTVLTKGALYHYFRPYVISTGNDIGPEKGFSTRWPRIGLRMIGQIQQ